MDVASLLFQVLLNGVFSASMYILLSSGISFIWGTMQCLNLCHGEFYMVGAYLFLFALYLVGDVFIAAAISVLAVLFLAMIVYRFTIYPFYKRKDWVLPSIMVTLGLSIFLQNFAMVFWGERYRSVPYFVEGSTSFLGASISNHRLLIMLISALVIGVFWFFLKASKMGKAIRAVGQDKEAAEIQGISSARIYMLTFSMSVALAAIGGIMLAPILMVYPWMGAKPYTKGLVIAVLGGLGNLKGAVFAGLLVGMLEAVAANLISAEWVNLLGIIAMIAVLYYRPSGIFGVKE